MHLSGVLYACVRVVCSHFVHIDLKLFVLTTIFRQVDLFEAALAITEVSRMIVLSESCIPIAPMKEVLFQLWKEEKVR